MTRRRRGLSPEERDLWQKVTATAMPLHPQRSADPDTAAEPPVHPQPRKTRIPRRDDDPLPPQALPARLIPRTAVTLIPPIADRLSDAPLRMDRNAHRAMTRGRTAPEARIDLHGLTLAEAQPELTRFILRAQEKGLRLVLVITGKGRVTDDHGPIPVRRGLLRHQVPDWLSRPPLSLAVLQIAPAHIRHGGEGAYYVYLSRR
jgi:DNA-nicking Smr family endonuclease